MKMMEELSNVLRSTLSSDYKIVTKAEQRLKLYSTDGKFGEYVMTIIKNNDIDNDIKIAASIALKNFIIKNWPESIETENCLISYNSRMYLKVELMNEYVKLNNIIRNQFIEIILHISKYEFPKLWPALIEIIAQIINDYEINKCISVLKLSKLLFNKYKFECISQELWSEIEYVLSIFAQPLTIFLNKLYNDLRNSDERNICNLLKILKYVIEIYSCLISQDFPEYFEDHKKEWLETYLSLLEVEVDKSKDDICKSFYKVKSKIIQVIVIFIQKYYDDINEYMNRFVTSIWNITINGEQKNEILASECIHFMRNALILPSMGKFFDEKSNVISLCDNIILPYITVSTNEELLFDNEPDEFIRNEIDGDLGSRQYSTSELIHALCTRYENTFFSTILDYISHLMVKYNENILHNWKYKDSALRIIIAICNQSNNFGRVKLPSSIDLNKIYNDIVLPELNNNSHDIVLASCIKYIIFFHKYMDNQIISESISTYVSLLSNNNKICIKLLTCVLIENIFIEITPQDNIPLGDVEFLNLYKENTYRLNKVCENLQVIYSYIITSIRNSKDYSYPIHYKCLISLLLHTHSLSKEYLLTILHSEMSELDKFCTSSEVTPLFSRLYFESLILCIRMIYIHLNEQCNDLFPHVIKHLMMMLEKNDFGSLDYIIQVLSVVLNYVSDDSVIINMLPKLIDLDFWEVDNLRITSNSLLLTSFAITSPDVINKSNCKFFVQLFEKFSEHSRYDQVSYQIATALVFFKWESVNIFPREIFITFFNRLTKLKKPRYVYGFSLFIYVFIIKFGANAFVDTVEGIQQFIINKIIQGVLFYDLETFTNVYHRRIVLYSLMKIMFEVPSIYQTNTSNWIIYMKSLYNTRIPSEPIINDAIERYYKLLGNNDIDLIIDQNIYDQNGIRFTCHNIQPLKIDYPKWLHEQLNNLKTVIGDKMYEYIITK